MDRLNSSMSVNKLKTDLLWNIVNQCKFCERALDIQNEC